MSIGYRIKYIRETLLNLKQKPFSQAIKISQGNLSEIESDKFLPSVNTIISISKYSNVSTDWILLGEEEDLIKKDQEFKKILELYSYLDKSDRIQLGEFIDFLNYRMSQKRLEVVVEHPSSYGQSQKND